MSWDEVGAVLIPCGLLVVAMLLYGVAIWLMEREDAKFFADDVEEWVTEQSDATSI